jgi:hypothetical protein
MAWLGRGRGRGRGACGLACVWYFSLSVGTASLSLSLSLNPDMWDPRVSERSYRDRPASLGRVWWVLVGPCRGGS